MHSMHTGSLVCARLDTHQVYLPHLHSLARWVTAGLGCAWVPLPGLTLSSEAVCAWIHTQYCSTPGNTAAWDPAMENAGVFTVCVHCVCSLCVHTVCVHCVCSLCVYTVCVHCVCFVTNKSTYRLQ